jgi:hypothetical protein
MDGPDLSQASASEVARYMADERAAELAEQVAELHDRGLVLLGELSTGRLFHDPDDGTWGKVLMAGGASVLVQLHNPKPVKMTVKNDDGFEEEKVVFTRKWEKVRVAPSWVVRPGKPQGK